MCRAFYLLALGWVSVYYMLTYIDPHGVDIVARPKVRTTPTQVVPARFEPEDVIMIDRLRGDDDRSTFIRNAVRESIKRKNKAR